MLPTFKPVFTFQGGLRVVFCIGYNAFIFIRRVAIIHPPPDTSVLFLGVLGEISEHLFLVFSPFYATFIPLSSLQCSGARESEPPVLQTCHRVPRGRPIPHPPPARIPRGRLTNTRTAGARDTPRTNGRKRGQSMLTLPFPIIGNFTLRSRGGCCFGGFHSFLLSSLTSYLRHLFKQMLLSKATSCEFSWIHAIHVKVGLLSQGCPPTLLPNPA